MGVLIGCKTHYYFLYNCSEAVIKTDLKSLITLLSCYNNPDSARMARISHRLYSLPFKWSLQHVAGVDLPLADALSRLYPPYRAAFADRHLRYPDLKRENIIIPPEWTKTPNTILTTADILRSMHDQIVYVEKSSSAVKNKQLRALVAEIAILYDELQESADTLIEQIHGELEEIEATAKGMDKHTGPTTILMNPLTAVSPKVLITPHFLVKHQNENPRLHRIITQLRTIPRGNLKPVILSRYRLLNDSILVTRKNQNLPFDSQSNIRIVCDTKMTLIILSLLHVMGGHYGINTLARIFLQTYKSNNSLQSYATMVALGCRACRFHRPVNKKTIPPGRVPLPPYPFHTFHMDHMCFKKDLYWKGKKIEAALNIIDLYSNLLYSFLVPDQKATTTIKCLKELFSTLPAPFKMVSDNGPALCANREVLGFLKSKGVQTITTITPYNSKGNKTEMIHKTLRETLQLVKETFQRKSQFDMYFTVIEMLNNRPLSLVLYPHVRKALGGNTETVTPFSLHYGFKPPAHPLVPMEDQLAPDDREKYQQKWQKIIKEHDSILQEELNEKNKNFKENEDMQKGDLVLLENKTAHKENLKYYQNLYEIISIKKARYYCAPLFGGSPLVGVSGNLLKPYKYTELFELLPAVVRHLMGESLSPEHLKNNKTSDPRDFQDWGLIRLPDQMRLRNRLTPASLVLVPAVNLSQTNTLSHDSSREDTDSDISFEEETRTSQTQVPTNIPKIRTEFQTSNQISGGASNLSSILTISPEAVEGAPQLVSTDQGVSDIPSKAVLITSTPKPIPLVRKPSPLQLNPSRKRPIEEIVKEIEERREQAKLKYQAQPLKSALKRPYASSEPPGPIRKVRVVSISSTPPFLAPSKDDTKPEDKTVFYSPEQNQPSPGSSIDSEPELTRYHTPNSSHESSVEHGQDIQAAAIPEPAADTETNHGVQQLAEANQDLAEDIGQQDQAEEIQRPVTPEKPKQEQYHHQSTPRPGRVRGDPVITKAGRVIHFPKRFLDFETMARPPGRLFTRPVVPSSYYSETNTKPLTKDDLKEALKQMSEDISRRTAPLRPPSTQEEAPTRVLTPDILVFENDPSHKDYKPPSATKTILKTKESSPAKQDTPVKQEVTSVKSETPAKQQTPEKQETPGKQPTPPEQKTSTNRE
jgi:hypothetical protein